MRGNVLLDGVAVFSDVVVSMQKHGDVYTTRDGAFDVGLDQLTQGRAKLNTRRHGNWRLVLDDGRAADILIKDFKDFCTSEPITVEFQCTGNLQQSTTLSQP